MPSKEDFRAYLYIALLIICAAAVHLIGHYLWKWPMPGCPCGN